MRSSRRTRSSSSERLFQTFLDWVRRLGQFATIIALVAVAYLLYGLFAGGITVWGTLDAAARARIGSNVHFGIQVLNISVGVLLLSLCVLYYDEETLGYALVASSVLLYYGVPFLMDYLMVGQFAQWERTGNVAALSIYNELRFVGVASAVPGVILTVRDLFLRLLDGVGRKRDQFSAMPYGGTVQEETPVSPALIGALAKCWQLPFCREFVRIRCPIFHARTRCWRERVGCMCEETVIRHAMDAMMAEVEVKRPDGPVDFAAVVPDERRIDLDNPTGVKKPVWEAPPPRAPKISRKQVRIPHNPNLTMSVKRERCRNCVIYNEHQRLKYQALAPLIVLALPALAYWRFAEIQGGLNHFLQTADRVMSRLSLDPHAREFGIVSSITSASVLAEYILIGCLVVIFTTMVLRLLEYLVFKLKV